MPSITQLTSVDSVVKIEALNALGIFTVVDMAEYAACRHAEYVMSALRRDTIADAGVENYVEAAALTPDALAHLGDLDVVHLISVSEADAALLEASFAVSTLAELAELAPYIEAQRLVLESVRGAYYEKPSAPAELMPKLIGSTHMKVRYSNYIKEREQVFEDYALLHLSDADEPEPAAELIDIFYRAQLKFHLGYLASIHQKWISAGTHLGGIVHSLALAPGESRNIVVLDWFRRQRSSRDEDTTTSEQLRSEFAQTHAVNEVVETTANEHLYGSTTVDATTKTTGAGLVGGTGGGAAASGSSGVDLMSIVGLPIKAAGSATGTSASSIGGSLVYSNGSVQGTLKSETTGTRSVDGELVQDISDATVQNASNVRSVRSTVVVEDQQRGGQRAQTSNVTNYNHSHAMTVQYWEVLDSYRVATGIDSLSPVLFLPFGPMTFTIEVIKSYWYVFNKAIRQLQPGKAFEWNQVVRDFNPQNEAFDASGDLRVERVKITRSRSYSEPVRVEFYDADPVVILAVDGFDMDGCMTLKLTGSSNYVSYGVLDLDVLDVASFFTTDSFEIDEGIKATLSSDFMVELKRMLKIYLDDRSKTPNAPFGTDPDNLEDNELGVLSKRDNLKTDVDNGRFSIINGDATVDLNLTSIEYTVADRNDQQQVITQTVRKTYSYGVLRNEISEEIADVTAHINTQLATVADINAADTIAAIEEYFAFHKYGFTKYLLANLEAEQIKDIIEHLGIVGVTETLAVSALIDPKPVALTENMLVFQLKEDPNGLRRAIGQNYFATITAHPPGDAPPLSLSGAGLRQPAIRKSRETTKYQFTGQPMAGRADRGFSTANFTLYVSTTPNKNGGHDVEGSMEVIQVIGNRRFSYPMVLAGTASAMQDGHIQIGYTAGGALPDDLTGLQHGTLDWTFDFPPPSGEHIADIVHGYVVNLAEHESIVRQRKRWSDAFLPSPGVFAEAILSRSNASEYLDPRRFFAWHELPIPNPAPAVQPVNVNQDYTQPVPGTLAPTVPVSVLNQLSPIQYPMPTSLTSALDAVQNGAMFTDMSKTDQLTPILATLATLANTTAQQAGSLAGDAAANALNSAVALGQQVADMVGTAMATNTADPPRTLTEKGVALSELDTIAGNSGGGPISDTDCAAAPVVGAVLPVPPPPPPPPPPVVPVPPVTNTSDTISGTLSIRVGLPDPYDYATVNLLELIDSFIPEVVDEASLAIYQTLKSLVVSIGDDASNVGKLITLLEGLGLLAAPETGGASLAVIAIIELLTSPTFISLGEDVLILLYNVVYSFAFPHVGFAGGLDLGTWLSAPVFYSKTKGKAAQVSTMTPVPFNIVSYYVGRTPINTAPNPPAWAAEALDGSLFVDQTQTDPSKLRLTVDDDATGDSVTITVDADQELLFDMVSIVQKLRDDLFRAAHRDTGCLGDEHERGDRAEPG
ncbi:hypothetical protein [Actinopolymorpha pittospori]|uniref:Uncharacterized protein n=1 Tax=Actinopolymorpha pittospori TaxID=648752 RepID=A0A927MPM7_9ACTN|nr:hypothetical protein [Actinopolymorpha pittospori]MBE1603779.1 hypothetical protein [Actinopolymorpha pittospori]